MRLSLKLRDKEISEVWSYVWYPNESNSKALEATAMPFKKTRAWLFRASAQHHRLWRVDHVRYFKF